MAEPTQPGELSDAALERALARLKRVVPLDPEEIDGLRHLLKRLTEGDLVILHEVIEQWTYDKRRTAESASKKNTLLGRVPLVGLLFTILSAIVGGLVSLWAQRPGGH